MIKRIIRHYLRLISQNEHFRHWYRMAKGTEVLHNVNGATASKRCLVIYITQPFLDKSVSNAHQNQWQAKEMARIIGSMGYIVDVTHYQYKYVHLRHHYDLVIGLIPRGIDIYSSHLKKKCIRIAYLTSMNLDVSASNELKRLKDLQNRRGVELRPRRAIGFIEPIIEQFNAAFFFGNEYNFLSYTDAFKMPPSFRIANTGHSFDWVNTNCAKDPHKFMFFGSSGQVHKGLDLLLEVFSECIPDCQLYVCGFYESEDDFKQEYHKELYETPNIFPMGFVNIDSNTYRNLCEQCAYTILPSCAEGCAGSVITNMSAGIIPIVSKECGFLDDEVISLPDCSKETITKFIKDYSHKNPEWLRERGEHSFRIAKERYSDRNFVRSFEYALQKTLAEK